LENKIAFNKIIKKYKTTFNFYGFSDHELNEKYKNHIANDAKCSINDFVWSLFHQLLIISANKAKTEYELYKSQWEIYLSMWSFRRHFEKSKANEIHQLHLKAYIQMSSCESRLYLKCNVISHFCCDYCDSLNGVKFEIDDVIKNQYLGSIKCTNEKGCNCCYSLVPERDSEGFVIKKKRENGNR
jgi:hypothetical protein